MRQKTGRASRRMILIPLGSGPSQRDPIGLSQSLTHTRFPHTAHLFPPADEAEAQLGMDCGPAHSSQLCVLPPQPACVCTVLHIVSGRERRTLHLATVHRSTYV